MLLNDLNLVTLFTIYNFRTLRRVIRFDRRFALCAGTIKQLHGPAAADAVAMATIETVPRNREYHLAVKLELGRNNAIIPAAAHARQNFSRNGIRHVSDMVGDLLRFERFLSFRNLDVVFPSEATADGFFFGKRKVILRDCFVVSEKCK